MTGPDHAVGELALPLRPSSRTTPADLVKDGCWSGRARDSVFNLENRFDGAYEERGLFILTMPRTSSAIEHGAMLDRLVTYMKSRPGVWFATHEQIARHVQGGLR